MVRLIWITAFFTGFFSTQLFANEIIHCSGKNRVDHSPLSVKWNPATSNLVVHSRNEFQSYHLISDDKGSHPTFFWITNLSHNYFFVFFGNYEAELSLHGISGSLRIASWLEDTKEL